MDAAIDIRPIFNPLNFIAQACPFRLAWNRPLRIPVPAGDHMVVVWSSYMRFRHLGVAHALVHLEPGEVVGLSWEMPLTAFSSSSMAAIPVGRPFGLAAPDIGRLPPSPGNRVVWPPHPVEPLTDISAGEWHPDPTGRFRLRWWDGSRWTDGVSDGATTSSAPL